MSPGDDDGGYVMKKRETRREGCNKTESADCLHYSRGMFVCNSAFGDLGYFNFFKFLNLHIKI